MTSIIIICYWTHQPTRIVLYNKDENIPQSLYIFRRAADNITGLNTRTRIESKNTFLIVVLESGEFQTNLDFLHQLKRIQRLQTKMKIGMFFSSQFVSI